MKLHRRVLARRGFTLIELMVSVAIALAITLAITLTLIRSESNRRTLTATNDTAGNAAYLSFTLDRLLRSAGSGLTQSWRFSYGCPLQATRAGLGAILPRASAYPAPFASVALTLRVAPLVVHAGVGQDGSDVLVVQSGAAGLSESPLPVLPNSSTGTELRVPVTLGLLAQDLLLLVQDNDINDAPQACVLQQVANGFTGTADQLLALGGNYHATTVGSVVMNTLATTERAWALPLGNQATSRPSFVLLGVNDERALVAYDLLRLDGTDTVMPLADGVVDLRARYGVDTDDNGTVDQWVSPAAAAWSAATLLDGSVASRTALSRILSVRVALVLRGTVQQTAGGQLVDVTPSTLTLFADLPEALRVSHSVNAADRPLRHQIVEFTVPLRNAMLTQRP